MSGLPKGWAWSSLAELSNMVGGKTPSKAEPRFWSNGTIPWVSPKDMKVFDLHSSEDQISELAVSDGGMSLLAAKSILMVTRSGILAHTFPVAITHEPVTINQDIKAVPPAAGFNTRYLAYNLKAQEQTILTKCAKSGTTVASVETERLNKLPIPLAPLPEQKRIADQLDSTLARVDSCRARLDRLPTLLKRFRQSVLAAATSGKLTEDWRINRSLDEAQRNPGTTAPDSGANVPASVLGWSGVTVGNLCQSVFDGPFGSNLKSDDYTESGVRVVRLENIGHLAFDADKETWISEEKYQGLSKHTLNANDILFSSFVDEEVRVCLYPANLPTAGINKADCFCLRLDQSKCLPKFMAFRLACKTTYLDLRELVHGATRPRINLKQLRQYPLGLPSMEEQHEIVRRVETLFAFADRLEARLATAHKQVDQLTPALLAKAFRGELVPQDPNDEPAAELLKRLATQREAAPKTKSGKKSKV